uniref:Uncharacterized protein n=1 Tax=Nothobranchius rachovii TaxID=451742 RepID=A0A1A8RYX6_9TELE
MLYGAAGRGRSQPAEAGIQPQASVGLVCADRSENRAQDGWDVFHKAESNYIGKWSLVCSIHPINSAHKETEATILLRPYLCLLLPSKPSLRNKHLNRKILLSTRTNAVRHIKMLKEHNKPFG